MTQSVARRQFSLLQRARDFRLLFFASVGSGIGTRLAVLALMVDVWDRTGSSKWVAAVLVADFVPLIAIGLLFGSLVDRLSRRRLMIISDLARAAVFCALPFAPNAATVVALAAVAGFATGFFRPAAYAGLPNLVRDEDLPNANGLFQAAENVTWMLGPLVGGALLSFTGPDAAYWFNAATFVFSALLIVRIAEGLLQAERAPSEGHLRDLAAGFRLAGRSRALLTVLVGWSLTSLAIGNSDVAEVELARVAFDAGNFGLGLLMGTWGLGLILGSVVAGTVEERLGPAATYGGSIAAIGVGVALAGLSPNVWVAAALLVAVGTGNGIAVVMNSVLVQRGVADQLRGRAFTLAMSITYAALFAGMLSGGFVSEGVGARATWVIAGTLATCGGIAAYALARGVPRTAPPEAPVAEDVLPVGAAATSAPVHRE